MDLCPRSDSAGKSATLVAHYPGPTIQAVERWPGIEFDARLPITVSVGGVRGEAAAVTLVPRREAAAIAARPGSPTAAPVGGTSPPGAVLRDPSAAPPARAGVLPSSSTAPATPSLAERATTAPAPDCSVRHNQIIQAIGSEFDAISQWGAVQINPIRCQIDERTLSIAQLSATVEQRNALLERRLAARSITASDADLWRAKTRELVRARDELIARRASDQRTLERLVSQARQEMADHLAKAEQALLKESQRCSMAVAPLDQEIATMLAKYVEVLLNASQRCANPAPTAR